MVHNGLTVPSTAFLLILAGLVVYAQPRPLVPAEPKPDPLTRVLHSKVVAVGHVTSIEKEPVRALAVSPAVARVFGEKADETAPYRVANVRIDERILGLKNETHLKVGTAGTDAELAVGRTYLFHLKPHPDGGFYVSTRIAPPVTTMSAADFDQAVAEAKKAAGVYTDPVKALKAEKAEDRGAVAVALVVWYRRSGTEPDAHREEPLPEEESRLLLKALADADWPRRTTADWKDRVENPLKRFLSTEPWDAQTAFLLLGLTSKDGWTPPTVALATGTNAGYRDQFKAWLDGAGKEYRVKKLVPK
jgi:hypothetical protein